MGGWQGWRVVLCSYRSVWPWPYAYLHNSVTPADRSGIIFVVEGDFHMAVMCHSAPNATENVQA